MRQLVKNLLARRIADTCTIGLTTLLVAGCGNTPKYYIMLDDSIVYPAGKSVPPSVSPLDIGTTITDSIHSKKGALDSNVAIFQEQINLPGIPHKEKYVILYKGNIVEFVKKSSRKSYSERLDDKANLVDRSNLDIFYEVISKGSKANENKYFFCLPERKGEIRCTEVIINPYRVNF